MLLLEDTNGDDKADKRTVLSTGWGISDSHAGPSSLLYGPDNYIWGTVGYAGFKGEMNGRPMQFSQGVYRFKPDGSAFEFVTGSTNNTWGLGFSETFDVFGSTANNDPSFYVAIPNRYFEGVEGFSTGARPASGLGYQSAAQFYAAHFITPYIRQVDVHGGYTAAAGHQLYTARRFPKAYWNRIAFITEPTAHLVGQGIMEKDGAGFVTRDGYNLLAGAEEWVAPVHAQAGPDGAVWVADWYNFIAQHNPTPPGYSNGPGNAYETSMRDRHRGRIYRVVPKGTPEPRTPALSARPKSPARSAAATTAELVATLSSDNMLWRLHAQRLLVERGRQDAVPALVALTRNTSVDEVGLNGGALHAIWTLDGLGAVQDLTSDAGRARGRRAEAPRRRRTQGGGDRRGHTPGRRTGHRRRGHCCVTATCTRGWRRSSRWPMPRHPTPSRRRSTRPASSRPTTATAGSAGRCTWPRIAIGSASSRCIAPTRPPCRRLRCRSPLRLGSNRPDWRLPEAAAIDRRLEGHGGAWQLGDQGAAELRWRRVVHADLRCAVAGAHEAQFRAHQPGRRDLGERSVGAGATPRPGGAQRAAGLHRARRGAARRFEHADAADPELSRRRRIPEPARSVVRRTRRHAAVACRHMEVTRRAADQRRDPVRQTRRTRRASRAGDDDGRGRLRARRTAAPAARPDVTIALSVVPGQMKFDRADLTVAPGQLVQLVFTNPDVMQHNFILGAIGSLAQLGAAADQMLTTGDALAQSYVPQTPLVLFSTSIVDPGQTLTVQFRAPSEAGAYPYACTFPGHWRIMNGTLTVKATGTPIRSRISESHGMPIGTAAAARRSRLSPVWRATRGTTDVRWHGTCSSRRVTRRTRKARFVAPPGVPR